MQMMIRQRTLGLGQANRKVASVGKQQRFRPVVARGTIRFNSVSIQSEEKQVATSAPAETNGNGTNANASTHAAPAPPTTSDLDILPLMWEANAKVYGDLTALEDPHRIPGSNLIVTHKELAVQMLQLAGGMQAAGLAKGDRVSIFSENSSRWIVTDQAVMMNGAVGAVRGSTAPLEELAYIARHSESKAIMLQDCAALQKIAPDLKQADAPALKFIMVMWGTTEAVQKVVKDLGLPDSLKVLSYDEVMAKGASTNFQVVRSSPNDVATLCYTSGTTGHPKAVMLTHANIMYQVRNLRYFVPIVKGETSMSLLPPWHIYERTAGYFMLGHGLRVVYSTIPKFGQDLAAYKPHHFVCVPLVLDTLHSRVMGKLKAMPGARRKIAETLVAASLIYIRNKRIVEGLALQHAMQATARSLGTLIMAWFATLFLKPIYGLAQKMVFSKVKESVGVQECIICGGGSLAPHLDDFFEALGVKLLNGWGLTETSPVLACRRGVNPDQNIRGSTGLPTPGTSLRVVDPETLVDVPDGTKGLIIAKGPGVMPGYLKDEESTAKAFRAGPGWFDTGDLGFRVAGDVPGAEKMAGHIVLTGRAKDTIVMSTGKNVEPEPIENKIVVSPIIKHLIVIGQDKRELGALVFPDFEALAALAKGEKEQAAAPSTPAPAAGSAADAAPAYHAPHSPEEMQEMYLKEVVALNRKRGDYHTYENILHISVMTQPLSAEAGTLTRTMKPRRPQIYKVFAKEVDALMSKLR